MGWACGQNSEEQPACSPSSVWLLPEDPLPLQSCAGCCGLVRPHLLLQSSCPLARPSPLSSVKPEATACCKMDEHITVVQCLGTVA